MYALYLAEVKRLRLDREQLIQVKQYRSSVKYLVALELELER